MVQVISAQRTLVLPEYLGQTSGLQFPLIWPPKDPADSDMDFSLDISGWLAEIQDTIATVSAGWTPNSTGDLLIPSMFSHNGVITIITNGGLPFITYAVTLSATTAILGAVLTRTIRLPVEPRFGSVESATGAVSGVSQ